MSALSAFRKSPHRPRVIGHRGVRRPEIPENTLLAFEAAVKEGASAIELDVRVCASGELVVMHDATLEHMSGGRDTRLVSALAWSELSRVEFEGGARVLRLDEALEFASGHDLPVNVELKRDVPSRTMVVRESARLLRDFASRLPLLLSSFDPPMLAAFGLLCPLVPRALLVAPKGWLPRLRKIGGILRVQAIHLERSIVRPSIVEGLSRRGMVVNVWTVNDVEEAKRLAQMGVDGIITDVPGELREALLTMGT